MKQAIAERIGTMTLVLFGCGAAVISGDDIGLSGISFAFGQNKESPENTRGFLKSFTTT